MASKGKALAKASSTRIRRSTSQQQPPLEIQLYETPAHEARAKIPEERRALHERTIKFPKGEDTFEERILVRGWEFMYEPSIPINLSWVREFYANRTKKDQREIFLRGKKISCSVSTIEKIFNIPKFKGKCGYSEISDAYNKKTLNMDDIGKEGATWLEDPRNPVIPARPKKKILNYEAWMWLKLIVCNINPTRHETTLSMEIVLWIYALMMDMPIPGGCNTENSKVPTIFPYGKWRDDDEEVAPPVPPPAAPADIPDTSRLEQISSPEISQNQQDQRAKSAEKGNVEEHEDFQSAEATGDASTYAGGFHGRRVDHERFGGATLHTWCTEEHAHFKCGVVGLRSFHKQFGLFNSS
ncbi:hypothetical protein PIB30_074003 [Stylosanthes scabra]|uniref:Putative plant transposon protein domain-containing protein n=1 Tax=Stylosanthes scabra TaxID=79078 RepID=A0ABU6ZN62_9FABA|nr:hypothetical protein [Stylosanthes scabra]